MPPTHNISLHVADVIVLIGLHVTAKLWAAEPQGWIMHKLEGAAYPLFVRQKMMLINGVFDDVVGGCGRG